MTHHYTYLLLNLGSVSVPLALSFDKKVHLYTYWWRMFPAIIAGAAIFITWDIWFTDAGVWSFSPSHTLGVHIAGMPVEEWMFFILVPYACIFIYECLRAYFSIWIDMVPRTVSRVVWTVMLVSFALLAFIFRDRMYTFITFSGLTVMFPVFYLQNKLKHFPMFMAMWVVHLIPFYTINGILTSLPVVMYNDAENMGIRIGSVPLEDAFYSMLLLLIIITVYEFLGKYRKPAGNRT